MFDEAERHYQALPDDERRRIETQPVAVGFARYVAGLAELPPDVRRHRQQQMEEHVLLIGALDVQLAELGSLRDEVTRLRDILRGIGAVATTAYPVDEPFGT